MENKNKQVIEINGVRLEVDMRYAKRIDTFRVGDAVKVLVKEYERYTSYPGVIIGFDAFEKQPTINVAYIKNGYSDSGVHYVAFNASADENCEICPAGDESLSIDRERIIARLDADVVKAEQSVDDAKRKRALFDRMYGIICAAVRDDA